MNVEDFIVKNLIVHQIKKEQQQGAELDLAPEELPADALSHNFIKEVISSYYHKRSKFFGTFNADKEAFPFQSNLDDFLKTRRPFLDFSRRAAQALYEKVSGIRQATGGYLVLSFLESEQCPYFIALMLHNVERFRIEEFHLKRSVILDIDKLDLASFIDIAKWRKAVPPYLSFIRGRKVLSNYFREFIGCTEFIESQKTSEQLQLAVIHYLGRLKLTDEEREKRKNKVFDYCAGQINENNLIFLGQIGPILRPEDPDDFHRFANNFYMISPSFEGHRKVLENLVVLSYSSRDLTIRFNHALLNKTVHYDREKEELRISELPESLVQELDLITK